MNQERKPYQPGALNRTDQSLGIAQVSIQQEIAEILSLTPTESRQERVIQGPAMAERYKNLRVKIVGASPLVIGELIKLDHDYATREFDRRLDAGQVFPLDYLLFRAKSLVGSDLNGSDGKLAIRISAGIARSTPTASVDEVLAAFETYTSIIDAHVTFLDEVLSYREDMDEIATQLEQRARSSDKERLVRSYDMEWRKKRALMLKDQRAQANIK